MRKELTTSLARFWPDAGEESHSFLRSEVSESGRVSIAHARRLWPPRFTPAEEWAI